ncbi:MAG: hypothetical protein ACPMAQ_04100 [Phycisphaerae bacterium]
MPLVLFASGLLGVTAAVPSWSLEYDLTANMADAYGQPSIAFDSTGRLHCVYTAAPGGGDPPRIYYRQLVGAVWSARKDFSGPNYKGPTAEMALDGCGNVRVDGTRNTPCTVYHWRYRGTTLRGSVQLSDGPGGSPNCSFPLVRADENNNVHVIWAEGNKTGGKGDIMDRRCVGENWEPQVNPTNNGSPNPYGSANPAPDSFMHSGTMNGRTHYYAAFACDRANGYSSAATVAAMPEGTVDFDGDADVDLQDFAFFQLCLAGPNQPFVPLAGCEASDTDCDGDVDLMDFRFFQGCFNGPNRVPSC